MNSNSHSTTNTFAGEPAEVLCTEPQRPALPPEAHGALEKFHETIRTMPKAGRAQGFNDQGLPRAARLAKLAGVAKQEAIRLILATQVGAERDVTAEVQSTVDRIYDTDDSEDHLVKSKKARFQPFDSALVARIVEAEKVAVDDLVRHSPEKDLDTRRPREFLLELFPGGQLVTYCRRAECDGRTTHCQKTVLLFDGGPPEIDDQEFVVPNPAIRRFAKTKDGKPSEHCAGNYGPRHYIVIESDQIPKDQAASVIWHLSQFATLMMVVDTGGKSLHAFFDCEGVPESDVLAFFSYAHRLGADPKMWAVGQFARMPNGTRLGGARQRVLYWNPSAKGREWNLKDLPGNRLVVRSVFDIPDDAPEESNLLGDRFLCRGKGVMVVGPTGIGKSSFEIQSCVQFGMGRDFFGLKPQKPLRILIAQAENDAEELRQMVVGAVTGANLSSEDRKRVAENVFYVTMSGVPNWIELLEPHVARLQPDLLILDPLFAFFKGSVSDQALMSTFLRTELQPFLERHNMGVIILHHVNKPPNAKKDRPDWQAGDFAYAGSGSVELANWCKGVIAIRNIGKRHVFELIVGKRHRRAGFKDKDGNTVDRLYLKHSADPAVIFWELADEEDAVGPETHERLGDLRDAFLEVQEGGLARKAALAQRMGIDKRTVDRMFEGREVLRAPAANGKRAMIFSRKRGKISGSEVTEEGVIIASLRQSPNASRAQIVSVDAVTAQQTPPTT